MDKDDKLMEIIGEVFILGFNAAIRKNKGENYAKNILEAYLQVGKIKKLSKQT